LNADQILEQIDHIAERFFDEKEILERAEYKVLLLSSKIRELVALLNSYKLERL